MTVQTGFRDSTAMVGVGYTKFSKDSGVSTLALASEAIVNAVADAGLSMKDIDGIASFHMNDSAGPNLVGQALGIHDPKFYLEQFGGGSVSHSTVGSALQAVHAGVANYVVCYRALNSRSEFRMGATGRDTVRPNIETQYKAPYGLIAPAHEFSMFARAHMEQFGTTSEQLGSIAISERANACLNERAMKREPITMDDYLASRWIAEPFRLLDCCLETDGACAVVVTTAERARDLAKKPVYVSAAAWGGGTNLYSGADLDLWESGAKFMAPRLFAAAGIGPSDIDVAEIYDCFTYSVLVQLEDYGFCKKGEGGPYAASGAIKLGGRMPVNTHGGLLSEGYIHGLNGLCEAVLQLRGEGGKRQVPNAETALSTAQQGTACGFTSAIILHN